MKNIFSGILILLFMAMAGFCQESKQPLQIIIKSDKQVYQAGEVIHLDVTLQNTSDKELVVFWNNQELMIPEVGVVVKELGEGITGLPNGMVDKGHIENLYIKPQSSLTKQIVFKISPGFLGRVTFTYDYQGATELNFQSLPSQFLCTDPVISNAVTFDIVDKILKEGDSCATQEDCLSIDCSKYNSPVKQEYTSACHKSRCKCMCYGCE